MVYHGFSNVVLLTLLGIPCIVDRTRTARTIRCVVGVKVGKYNIQ